MSYTLRLTAAVMHHPERFKRLLVGDISVVDERYTGKQIEQIVLLPQDDKVAISSDVVRPGSEGTVIQIHGLDVETARGFLLRLADSARKLAREL